MIEIKVILSGKVKYEQDFGFHERDFGEGMEFECRGLVNGKLVLRAPGFGLPGQYGNGSICVMPPTLGPFDDGNTKTSRPRWNSRRRAC